MFHFMNVVRPFVNYAIFRELCDRMRFEVDCAKSHHRVISSRGYTSDFLLAQVMRFFQILSRRQREMKIARVATLELAT